MAHIYSAPAISVKRFGKVATRAQFGSSHFAGEPVLPLSASRALRLPQNEPLESRCRDAGRPEQVVFLFPSSCSPAARLKCVRAWLPCRGALKEC